MENEEILQQEVDVMEEEQPGGRPDEMEDVPVDWVRMTEKQDRNTDGLREKGDHQIHLLMITWVLLEVIM